LITLSCQLIISLSETSCGNYLGIMSGQRNVVTQYALLIGIDAYPELSFNSCVRDVRNIANYLKGVLNSVHIQVLTATKSADSEFCSPTEDPSFWPTHQNVLSAFEKITVQAKAGDFVYIHYSGHGTRTPWEPYNEFSNRSTGDLALVLLDGGKDNHVKHLWGSRLAFSLKAMVEKGLVVTLVLDCCFSGSVSRRKDPSIRYLPYDSEPDSNFPLAPEQSLARGADPLANRDASMLPNWLLNPTGYVILAACGPHEFAKELKSANGDSNGALSYFLLRTFIECDGLEKTHKTIYHHLCALFRKHWPQQNPILYGNKDQGFFDLIDVGAEVPSISIVERDGSLHLQAGQAHGICEGDRFVLSPLGSTKKDSDSREDRIIAKVIEVGALTSDLELLDPESIHAETGWIAKPLTQFSLRKFPIRLASNLPRLEEWFIALRERSIDVCLDTDGQPFLYHVILHANKEYAILDESSQKISNLPTMRLDQMDISAVCDIIEHLVRYKLSSDLGNMLPKDAFTESYEAQIMTRSGKSFAPGSILELEQDEGANFMFELEVKNHGDKTLYVHVFDLGPCWQVQDIYCGYEVVLPQRKGERFTGMLKKLKTMVPPEMREKGYRQCEDIIKVFITSQPTTFDILELPKLGKAIKKHYATRVYHKSIEVSDEWAALNFPIRTSLK
jgi:hypothetical protein